MKAMIFAAGLGTRLHPQTIHKPKALVEVAGKTMLERAIEKVASAGYHSIVVNVHHYAGQIIEFLNKKNNFGLEIQISDESNMLLDTGGGLLKAAPLLQGEDPFLLYNVDILSGIDLSAMKREHLKKKALATLAVRKRKTERYFIFDNDMRLSGWTNKKTGEKKIARQADTLELFTFNGIHIVEPRIFELISETGAFSIISLYLKLAVANNIYGFFDTSDLWVDMGKTEQLKIAEKQLRENA